MAWATALNSAVRETRRKQRLWNILPLAWALLTSSWLSQICSEVVRETPISFLLFPGLRRVFVTAILRKTPFVQVTPISVEGPGPLMAEHSAQCPQLQDFLSRNLHPDYRNRKTNPTVPQKRTARSVQPPPKDPELVPGENGTSK